MSSSSLDLGQVLSQLKDFQRRTVEHVFQRFYVDDPPARRFLVADEVGLGKTLVAKGVIACALDHLPATIERIDIVYICSNASIAQQNLNRLNVLGREAVSMATRLTMLPEKIAELTKHRVNFVSFTPGTTFDLKSRGGMMSERVLLYQMLRDRLDVPTNGLLNLLQATASKDNWRWWAEQPVCYHPGMADRFADAVQAKPELWEDLQQGCSDFHRYRDRLPWEQTELRYRVIGRLRQALASLCVNDLEPDLVILDEFQRFRHLLDTETEAGQLAEVLFNYEDARVLLLSATPYKMLTLNHEDEDHWSDFLKTLEFLCDDAAEVDGIREDLRRYRHGLYRVGTADLDGVEDLRQTVGARLRRVMCRTERSGLGISPQAMCAEQLCDSVPTAEDLRLARLSARVAALVEAQDNIEYWKSAPYFLNFVRSGYDLGRKLHDREDEAEPELSDVLRQAQNLLSERQVENYQRVDPGSARLRRLYEDLLEPGLWRLLWLPPSLPYHELGEPFASQANASKALIFTSWNAVPDAIAALCSYEAERRMLLGEADKPSYSELHRRRRGLLRYNLDSTGRVAGMPVLAMMYPCRVLMDELDPLRLAFEVEGTPPSLRAIRALARERVERLLRDARVPLDARDGRADERWYWLAPQLLDRRRYGELLPLRLQSSEDEEPSRALATHLEMWHAGREGLDELGPPPRDLVEVVADLGLAGPGNCAARALKRIVPGIAVDHDSFVSAVGELAQRLRLMLNLPSAMGVVRRNDDPYWQQVLRYAVDGNLQAVLDEWAHMLLEQEGLQHASPAEQVEGLSAAMTDALAIRTATLTAEQIRVQRGGGGLQFKTFGFRSRFAMRFGQVDDSDQGQVLRADTVRAAFNSPFHPFVLATTSIGQEGLDFHPYCHVVYHWNLPSNPVDLEQREGRVHRYKGFAIRKNLARRYGLGGLRGVDGRLTDPWQTLFDRALAERAPDASDLVPYWVYEVDGGATIERRVPMMPFSREISKLAWLKRSLAIYRMVFGQPRQSDLLEFLAGRLDGQGEAVAERCRIDLRP